MLALGHAEPAGEVGVDDRGEVVLGHAQHEHVARDAGVRHEDLDRAELLLDLGERRVDRGRVGDVATHREDARVGDVTRRVAAAGDRDPMTSGRERLGDREPDASIAAGDEDDAAGHGCQRSTTLAQVMPAPKPESRSRSPGLMRPSFAAVANPSGIVPALLLPV